MKSQEKKRYLEKESLKFCHIEKFKPARGKYSNIEASCTHLDFSWWEDTQS
jgi:hypothetical protein